MTVPKHICDLVKWPFSYCHPVLLQSNGPVLLQSNFHVWDLFRVSKLINLNGIFLEDALDDLNFWLKYLTHFLLMQVFSLRQMYVAFRQHGENRSISPKWEARIFQICPNLTYVIRFIKIYSLTMLLVVKLTIMN